MNFIDFKAAFDSVNREYIWACMKHYGIPTKYINIFKCFYADTVSAVRINDELTEWFPVKSGTGQDDIHSPAIFNAVINWTFERAMSNKTLSKGFLLQKRQSSRKPDIHITDADYADDVAALDSCEMGLQETTTNIVNYGSEAGLVINVDKTKCMYVGKHHTQRPYPAHETLNLQVYNQP